ncbi:TBC domain-containing protein kinase-like protein isoform X1 [Atheta coriaria]|uniref:TBC domain-containing protein kinase-like protein isoform X1 n=2 Tax=Dalotia coriaria TaxID=877792 RepID=UPI0031F3932B
MSESEIAEKHILTENIANKYFGRDDFQFGVLTFFAKLHTVDTCGSNGLPLTPNSITIYGKAQIFKSLVHSNLCQYLDIIRGKHERLLVVSQYCGTPLLETLSSIHSDEICRIAYQIIKGLDVLHNNNLTHQTLCSENVLLQKDGSVKLFNYALYSMTGYGQLVSFPLVQTAYSAPEVYLNKNQPTKFPMSTDIWSLGIILVELVLKQPLWESLKIGQKIRKILSLLQCEGRIFERIAREHKCYEIFMALDPDWKALIESCLAVTPSRRITTQRLLENKLFAHLHVHNSGEQKKRDIPKYEAFTIKEFYHWWRLAGGDVIAELKKQGLIRTGPPILSLPSLALIDGTCFGQEKNPNTLYDQRVVMMPVTALHERLGHLKYHHFHPLVHCASAIIDRFDSSLNYDASGLPLCIKEKDPEYQFHRIILFRRLLYGYPFTRDLIVRQARFDIPPQLRGEIWAALLNVSGDRDRTELLFQLIDKETQTPTDRQIEVDIPRCHQYNELLSSADGHRKLKRILKAWVQKNTKYVYWQGLDSLTAPFLLLHFNDEARAFACLSAFVPKYLHQFFLKDNSAVIQEYLARFSQLIAFHDPPLANHLHEINFVPELFAIPWFLTMFSHVFPLHKILHLWDKLLLGDSAFPLHIGLSVLTQLRSRLMSSGFNECILLFSDLPEVDIENCVKNSMLTFETTPKSVTRRLHDNESGQEITPEALEDCRRQNKARYPRISPQDVEHLVRNFPSQLLAIDIRNPTQFARRAIVDSLNIPISSVKFGEQSLEGLGPVGTFLATSDDKFVVVIGDEDTDTEMFPRLLLDCKVPKVCVLQGGFDALQTYASNNAIFTSS